MTPNVKVAVLNDRKPAWWGLGITPDVEYGYTYVTDAMQAAGMLYNLYLTPCQTVFNDVTIDIPGRRVVTREPSLGDTEPVVLDVVSDDFKMLQNAEIAERFDCLCKDYKLATLGVLDEGRKVWVAFETDNFDIQGDPFKGYLFAYGNQAGGGSFTVAYTSVRIVCQNTLMAAMNGALDLMKFEHKGRVADLVELRAWTEHEIASARQNAVAAWEQLVKTQVDKMQTADIIDAALPDPSKGKILRMVDIAPGLLAKPLAQELFDQAKLQYDKNTQTTLEHRLGVADRLMKFNDEFPQFAGTAYAVVNAVTEYADWPDKPRSDTPRATLFGYRNAWKQRAWAKAVEIATGKETASSKN